MSCNLRTPTYIPHSEGGILIANSRGDGYSIAIQWQPAYPDSLNYQVIYNIYYSTVREEVFTEGVKYVSITPNTYATEILEITPGDTFYFAVRASEYDPTWYNPNFLPDSGSSKIYPEGMLLFPLTETSTQIQISDIEQFPNYGVVQVGSELIQYSNRDLADGYLSGLSRGFLGTNIRSHALDGYDGYIAYNDPLIRFWKGFEEQNEVVFQATSVFNYPHYARTDQDGYKTVLKDILTTDLGASDASTENFPPYDHSGYHRDDPAAILRGDCIGTYIGGERYCVDGYLGVGNQIRGIPVQDANHQREEELLNVTGEPCVLIKRKWTGLRCNCFSAQFEYPEERCVSCYGTGFVSGYEQFRNPRRSDGRIMVRFSPTEDDLKMEESGLESTFIPDCWTIVYPAVKDRDILIRFNEDNTEEFRYEILNVTRNKIFIGYSGKQSFRAQRIRKTDPVYQWRAVRDTSPIPQTLTTSVGFVPGPGGIAPHVHTIIVPSGFTSLDQINGTTSWNENHNHPVIQGMIRNDLLSHEIGENLGHSHEIILI